MSNSWKQYGGTSKTDKFHKFSVGTLIADDILKLYENLSKGIEGVVIGRALYDKKFTFEEALYAVRKGIS